MAERIPIPCTNCGREKYFEGLCYWCRIEKERDEWLVMPDEEIEKKKQYVIDNIEDKDIIYQYFRPLFHYRAINTADIAKAAFAKEVYYPHELYRDALPQTVDKMINLMLTTPDKTEGSSMLCCLSLVKEDPGNKILNAFLELENNPREWRQKLYVDPSRYADIGGWTFDKDGTRIELVYPQAYPFVKGDREKDKAAIMCVRKDAKCSHCSCQMVDMLTVDGRDERLSFLGIDGVIKALTCPNCSSVCGPTYCRYTINGESEVLEVSDDAYLDENYMSDEDLTEFENNNFVLAREPVNPLYGCKDDITHMIGGMANWVQDTEYLDCPCCNKKMKYFAQIQDYILGSGDGTIYFEICTDCQIIGMAHQQT